MKICFIMYQGNMYSGGQGVYLYYLTRELARMGHEVHVLAGPPYPTLADGVIGHNLKTYSYWSYHHEKEDFLFKRNPLTHFHPVNFYEFVSTRIALSSLLLTFSVRAWIKLSELSQEHHFDIVHDNQTLSYGTWLMEFTGFPVLATIHHPLTIDLQNALRQAGSLYEKARRILWSPWVMQAVVARRMRQTIVVSETSRKAVQEAFKLDPARMHVVYNGIDTETFRPLPDVERQPGLILYVGNSEDRNKGARYLLEAMNLLKDDRRDFQLALVDHKKENLKLAPRLVQKYGLQSRVHFTGRVSTEQLVKLYNQAMMVVSPSLYEGFGLPAAEAMSCGAPVIATTGGAFPEVIDHQETGWLVPPGNAEALADAIRMFADDEELRARLGRAGRESILKRFSWRKAAEETLAVYEQMLAEKSREGAAKAAARVG
ncbi:MAG: glycosyltransferase family 4 protein [Chloroflexi bacterium]|nr:glycosyltransferase family 4 protein [Chloroflexota bacterium]